MAPYARDIGVVFDMDGVLIDSAEHHYRSWQELARDIDKPVTREQFDETFGMQNRDIIPRVFGENDQAIVDEWSLRKEAAYRELIWRDPPLVAGAAEVVAQLAAREVRLAIGSSAPRANIELVLQLMGVARSFTAIVSGDDVQRGKPDPQVYELACAALGLPPNNCVVIEDAPVGVEAARAAGAVPVAVLIHHPPSAFPGAAIVTDRLQDLDVEQIIQLVGKAD